MPEIFVDIRFSYRINLLLCYFVFYKIFDIYKPLTRLDETLIIYLQILIDQKVHTQNLFIGNINCIILLEFQHLKLADERGCYDMFQLCYAICK